MKSFLCLWTSLLFFHGFLSMAEEANAPSVAVPSAEDQVSPISETRDYPSRLLQAIEDENVDLFLTNVTDPAQIDLADEDGMTPLMLAVEENLPWYVEKILEQKPNLNLKNEAKDDALLLAMYSQNASVLKMLLEAGAQCLGLANGEQQSPWMIAARNNAYHLIPLLKNHCAADIDLRHPRTGKTALILAAQKGAIRTYDQLLKVPANPKIKDHTGKMASDYMVKWTKPRKKNR